MKYVSAAEFKAKCLKLMDEVQAGGEPITVTKRGKPVAVVVSPPPEKKPGLETLFGSMRGTVTIHDDILGPVDPDWEAKWEAKWDERGFPVKNEPGS